MQLSFVGITLNLAHTSAVRTFVAPRPDDNMYWLVVEPIAIDPPLAELNVGLCCQVPLFPFPLRSVQMFPDPL